MLEFLIVLGFIGIVVAIVQDFKYREVANWLNFGLLTFALAFRFFFSAFINDYKFLIFGLVGVGISVILGHLLYYGRLFAGGDAKLFIAFGAILPFEDSFYENNLIFFIFLISLLLGGAIYSLFYSGFLAFKNKGKFSKEFKKLFMKDIGHLYAGLAFSFAFILYVAFSKDLIFLFIPVFLIGIYFLYVYAKAVEQSCMIIEKNYNEISIGDWIIDEIKIGDRVIKPYWEGLSEEEVKLLKKHKKKILIKDGIPFTPAFLIAFSVIVYIKFFMNGNWGFWGFFS